MVDPPPDGSPLPAEHLAELKGFAFNVRACKLALQRSRDPLPESALAQADALYPWEKVSAWSRDYLLAAADFLGFWADQFAPLEFHPDAINIIAYRPYILLARSGLEAAAQGLWLVAADSAADCVRRHVRLMHRDFQYHHDALKAGQIDASAIQERMDELVERAAETDPSLRPRNRPPGFEKIIRNVAEKLSEDPDRWAYLWNAASGAAHGQNWFGTEAYKLLSKEEYEPGYYRVQRMPDPGYITATLDAAVTTLAGGTHLWLAYAGFKTEVWSQAIKDVFDQMPKQGDPK